MVSFETSAWQINQSHVLTIPAAFVKNGLIRPGVLYRVVVEEVVAEEVVAGGN